MKLKPCPFCGTTGKLFSTDFTYSSKVYWVECTEGKGNCPIPEMVTEEYDTEKQAIKAWNTRSND